MSESTAESTAESTESPTVECPIIGCCIAGKHSLSAAAGIVYNGPDSALLFCDDHFKWAFDLYCEYKELESAPQFNAIMNEAHCYGSFIHDEDWRPTDEYSRWEARATRALELREALQSKIDVPFYCSQGHRYYMNRLRDAIGYYRKSAILYGKWYTIARGGKKRRVYYFVG